MELVVELPDAIESGKSKMAACKLELRVSHLVHKIAMQFQWQYLSFRGPAISNGNIVNVVRPNRKKPEVADITGSTFFDLPLTPTSASVHASCAVLADLMHKCG